MSQNSANSLTIPGNPKNFLQVAKVIPAEFAGILRFQDLFHSGRQKKKIPGARIANLAQDSGVLWKM